VIDRTALIEQQSDDMVAQQMVDELVLDEVDEFTVYFGPYNDISKLKLKFDGKHFDDVSTWMLLQRVVVPLRTLILIQSNEQDIARNQHPMWRTLIILRQEKKHVEARLTSECGIDPDYFSVNWTLPPDQVKFK